MSLSKKTCVPCHEGIPPLDAKESNELLKQLKSSWIITQTGHLYQEYTFKNFVKAMEFANQIAVIAEQEGHHPDLKITYGICTVEIWTHKINGLSKSDFYLAEKIDHLLD